MRVAERLSGLFHSAAALATRPAAVVWTPPSTTALRSPQAVLTSQQVSLAVNLMLQKLSTRMRPDKSVITSTSVHLLDDLHYIVPVPCSSTDCIVLICLLTTSGGVHAGRCRRGSAGHGRAADQPLLWQG